LAAEVPSGGHGVAMTTAIAKLREALSAMNDAAFAADEQRFHDVYAEARAALDELANEVGRLEALVYVPGLWRCAKCELRVVATNFHVNDGRMSAGVEPRHCDNGCGPMWRVSEREAGNRLCDQAEVAADRIRELEARTAFARRSPDEAPLGDEHELAFCFGVKEGKSFLGIGHRTSDGDWLDGALDDLVEHADVRWFVPVEALLEGAEAPSSTATEPTDGAG
jgi:hypothetical protein